MEISLKDYQILISMISKQKNYFLTYKNQIYY